MEVSLLEHLICPFCGSSLKLEKEVMTKGKKIIYGILRCSCSYALTPSFPVVEGIVYLKLDSKAEDAVRALERGKTLKALKVLLESRMIKKIIPLTCLIERFFKRRPRLKFWNIIGLWDWKYWTYYLRYRYSSPSFIASIPFIKIIKENCKGLILDMCCGVGQFSYLLSKYIQKERIILADRRFTSLYFAKEYFISDPKGLICFEADSPMPFVDKLFSCILCLDSFHYIDSKFLLSKEFKRTLQEDGLLIIPHLHNQLVFNVLPGRPLSLSDYIRLFPDMEIRLYPEEELLFTSLHKDSLDLTYKYPWDRLSSADAVTLVGSKNQKVFKEYDLKEIVQAEPEKIIINPIYSKKKSFGEVKLKMKMPCKLYEIEYPLVKKYFQNEVYLEDDIKWLRDEKKYCLRKNFILVDVPKDFV